MEKVAFELACKSLMSVADRQWPDRNVSPVISHEPIWSKPGEDGSRPVFEGSRWHAKLVEWDGQEDFVVARGIGETEEEAWSNLEGDLAFLIAAERENVTSAQLSDLVSDDRP